SRCPVFTHVQRTSVIDTLALHDALPILSFELPWSARLGVEFSPIEDLAIELAGAIEGWSMHDAITIAPEGELRNLPGFPNPYALDRKSTRLNSSHVKISYAVFCLKKTNT